MTMEHASGKRRVSVWVWVVAGVVVVAAVAAGVLLLVNRGEAPEPEAVVVTLPARTPTGEPMVREAGSAYYEALPSTVLDFTLSESQDDPDMLAVGALEAYRLTYTGPAEVAVEAGQWATPEAAEAARAALTATLPDVDLDGATPAPAQAEAPSPTASETSTGSATEPPAPAIGTQTGSVTVDGTEVGTYVLVRREDGTASAVWSNGTAVLYAAGPSDELVDFYTAFPL